MHNSKTSHSVVLHIVKLTWTSFWYTLIHLLNLLDNDRRSFYVTHNGRKNTTERFGLKHEK